METKWKGKPTKKDIIMNKKADDNDYVQGSIGALKCHESTGVQKLC